MELQKNIDNLKREGDSKKAIIEDLTAQNYILSEYVFGVNLINRNIEIIS